MTSPRFALFGEVVECSLPLQAKLDDQLTNNPDATVQWKLAETAEVWTAKPAVFESDLQVEDQPALRVHEYSSGDKEGWLFAETDVANFFVSADAIEVEVLDPAYEYVAEIRLLGQLSAIRAHMHGQIAIHSSVVEIDGLCIALIAGNGGGKTSTTATLLTMGGSLVADDLLVISADGIAQSGYPQMRMWVPEATFFYGDTAELTRVHPALEKLRIPIGNDFGRFSSGPRSLDAVVFLDRTEAATARIEQLDHVNAHASLSGHLFLKGMLRSLGYSRRAISICADLVEQVPTYVFASPVVAHDGLVALATELVRSLRAAAP